MRRNTANNTIFHYRTSSVKTNDKIPIFVPFSQFLGQKRIFWKILLSHTTSYGFLASCQKLEKTNYRIPKKCPDRWRDGGMDERMDRRYFIGPFWLMPEVQKVVILAVIWMIGKNSMKHYVKNKIFYIHLNMEDITDTDYADAKRVFKDF